MHFCHAIVYNMKSLPSLSVLLMETPTDKSTKSTVLVDVPVVLLSLIMVTEFENAHYVPFCTPLVGVLVDSGTNRLPVTGVAVGIGVRVGVSEGSKSKRNKTGT